MEVKKQTNLAREYLGTGESGHRSIEIKRFSIKGNEDVKVYRRTMASKGLYIWYYKIPEKKKQQQNIIHLR